MNPWCAPQRIVARHRPNQGPHIGRDRRSPAAPSTLPGPQQAEAFAMPCDDGFRLPRSRVPCANRSTSVTATPTGTGPSSRDAAGEVETVAAPPVDGAARGPRGAARHVTARCPEPSRGAKSARTSSRTEPIGLVRQVQRAQRVRCFQYAQPCGSTSRQRSLRLVSVATRRSSDTSATMCSSSSVAPRKDTL
jgi:hypothetical protein